MGYSVRTKDWRFTQWVEWNGTQLAPRWDNVIAEELYDHRKEPILPIAFDTELENVVNDTANADIVKDLRQTIFHQFANDKGTKQ